MQKRMHHRQRLLHDGEAQQQHYTCASAKLVQSDGPGTSVMLSHERNENLAMIDRLLFYSQFELEYPMLYYKIPWNWQPFLHYHEQQHVFEP